MKKAYSFRLSEEAILAIRIQAKERECSEAAVVEGWAVSPPVIRSVNADDYCPHGISWAASCPKCESGPNEVSLPTPPPSDKRAMFESLKGKFGGKPDVSGLAPELLEPARPLHDVPQPGFEVNIEGEPHKVATYGKQIGLYYTGNGSPSFVGTISHEKMVEYWGHRIK